MFRTIEDCRLDLVAHTQGAPYDFIMENGDVSFRKGQRDIDYFPASAARVSFGNEDKTGKNPAADVKLMEYLAEHQHMSPFEHQSVTFLIECPMFIRSQIHRHRTFAYNEISRRYTEENLEFWIPTTVRKQAESNRQASADEIDGSFAVGLLFEDTARMALDDYQHLIANGVCREQARAVLPQSLLTKFYMTGNLRNWAHFIHLRTHDGAQQEVRVIAERIEAELIKLWPTAAGVLLGNGKGSSEETP